MREVSAEPGTSTVFEIGVLFSRKGGLVVTAGFSPFYKLRAPQPDDALRCCYLALGSVLAFMHAVLGREGLLVTGCFIVNDVCYSGSERRTEVY